SRPAGPRSGTYREWRSWKLSSTVGLEASRATLVPARSEMSGGDHNVFGGYDGVHIDEVVPALEQVLEALADPLRFTPGQADLLDIRADSELHAEATEQLHEVRRNRPLVHALE